LPKNRRHKHTIGKRCHSEAVRRKIADLREDVFMKVASVNAPFIAILRCAQDDNTHYDEMHMV
jgi:hypothetical protein